MPTAVCMLVYETKVWDLEGGFVIRNKQSVAAI